MFSLAFTCKFTSDSHCRIRVPTLPAPSWEFCVSYDFDYAFLSRKRKYRWPLVNGSLYPCRASSFQRVYSDVLFHGSLLSVSGFDWHVGVIIIYDNVITLADDRA